MAMNSHAKVRALIKNSKNIKSKDFFTNKIFKSHLEDMATNITKRYKGARKVRVVVDWNKSDGAPVAFTDNSNVYINAGTDLIHTGDIKLLYKRVLGLFAHELGHILWTDFVAASSYVNGLKRGLWFPRNPRLINYEMKVNEQDFWNLCAQSEQHKNMLIEYIMQISNALEDGFIEEQIFRTYPGVLGLGLKETRDAHWDNIPQLSEMIENEETGDIQKHKLFTMLQILLEYAKYGEVKYDNVSIDDEHLVLLGEMMPYVDEYMQSPPRERYALTSEITLLLFPVLKDFIESFLEQQSDGSSDGNQSNQNSDSSDENSSSGQGGSQGQSQSKGGSSLSSEQASELAELIKNVSQGLSGNSKQAQGDTTACASIKPNSQSNTQVTQNRAKTSAQIPSSGELQLSQNPVGESSDDAEENGASGDGEIPGITGNGDETNNAGDTSDCDGSNEVPPISSNDDGSKQFGREGTQIGYGEGECNEGNGTGQIEFNDEYQAVLENNLETKLNSLIEEMKENKAIKTLEGERTHELNTFANEISYGNAHKNIDIRVNRASEVTEGMEEAYKEISKAYLPIAKNLVRKYLQIADDARTGGRLDGLLMGRKFNAAAAYRNDGKVFVKNIMPQDMQPLAVALLLDESGSMSGVRSQVAMATAIIIQNFCEQLNIPIAIYGHSTGSYECELYSYIEFDTYTKKDKYRLTDIGARGCNRDGAALRYTAERLMTRPEEAKLLILVSDGQPNGSGGYWGAEAEADLRGIQKEYTKKGVCFCAAAIGDDKEIIKGIYGDSFLDISDLNQLPVKLVKVLSRYLHTV